MGRLIIQEQAQKSIRSKPYELQKQQKMTTINDFVIKYLIQIKIGGL
jgi:hypothetical protein